LFFTYSGKSGSDLEEETQPVSERYPVSNSRIAFQLREFSDQGSCG
jgi:hypothetical protein